MTNYTITPAQLDAIHIINAHGIFRTLGHTDCLQRRVRYTPGIKREVFSALQRRGLVHMTETGAYELSEPGRTVAAQFPC